MLLRWSAVLAALSISSGCIAQDFCASRDTNQLVWDKEFKGSIENYFGGQKAYVFWKNATIAEQVISGLGGPPDEVKRLDGNMVLASACRAHSCIEKAAVVIACPAKIAAVAVIHYCTVAKPGCADEPELTLYSDGMNLGAHNALKAWAAQALGKKFEGIPVRVRSPLQVLAR